MKVGDLIAILHKSGLFEVTEITPRFKSKTLRGLIIYDENDPDAGEEMQPLVKTIKKYLKSGVPVTMKQKDITEMIYCLDAKTYLEKEINSMETIIERYKRIMEELT